jgi:hypothetical protein
MAELLNGTDRKLDLAGGQKNEEMILCRALIPSHFPIFRAPSPILHPHRFLSAGKIANQSLSIKHNLNKVCKKAISLRERLAQKLNKNSMQTRSK